MKHFLVMLLLCLPLLGKAQQEIRGRVTDTNGAPLAFVNIVINEDPLSGTNTDIDGLFVVRHKSAIKRLSFSYIGYQPYIFNIDSTNLTQPLQIQLVASDFDLEEVVVIAGENPAHRIIRNTVQNRKANNPHHLDSYQCERYNKIVFSLLPDQAAFEEHYEQKDTSRKRIKKAFQRAQNLINHTSSRHLMVMETISNRYFSRPQQITEKVTHNKVSGFNNPTFVALANGVQPFGLYEDHLNLLDDAFLNPISPGSTSKYFFEIKDTIFQAKDTVFVIAFQPKKGKNFDALKGVLYINTNGYGLQNILAEPADKSLVNFKLEQQYQQTSSGHWFPEELHFEFVNPKTPSEFLGMRVSGKSYIRKVHINIPLSNAVFEKNETLTLLPEANNIPDSVFAQFREEPLDDKEKETYVYMDSLGKALKLDKRLTQLEALMSGIYPFGLLDINLDRIIASNQFENLRLGIGLQTSELVSKDFKIGGYVGYGLSDTRWKYGGQLYFDLNENKNTRLEIAYQKDIREPGRARFPFQYDIISPRLFAERMDQWESGSVAVSSFIFPFVEAGFEFRRSQFRPLYDYTFSNGDIAEQPNFNAAELIFKIRYAYGQTFSNVLGNRVPKQTDYPTLSIQYNKGIEGLFGGGLSYDRVIVAVEQSFQTRQIGRTSYRIEAGWASQNLPYSLLFGANGLGGGFQLISLSHNFQTMNRYEFLSDRFVHFFLRQEFGSLLFKLGAFQPEISIEQHMGFGDLQNPTSHQDIDFKKLSSGYFESGLIIDNILKLNYLNFAYLGVGAGAYYRYGAYSLPNWQDNIAYRITVDFSF